MNQPHSNRFFYAAVAIMLLTALLPMPAAVGMWLHARVTSLVVPVSEPLTRLATALRPPQASMTGTSDPVVREYEMQLERARERTATLEATVAYLARMLDEFQRGYAADAIGQYRLVAARRSAVSAIPGVGTFSINVGSSSGAEVGTLVISGGYQLVGRVSAVSSLTCEVLPITTPVTPRSDTRAAIGTDVIRVEFMPSESGAPVPGVLGTLKPSADGTGRLEGTISADVPVKIGDLARLNDPGWGDALSRLLVGRVVDLRPDARNSLLYQTVTVAPDMDVRSVYDVFLRIRQTTAPREDR